MDLTNHPFMALAHFRQIINTQIFRRVKILTKISESLFLQEVRTSVDLLKRSSTAALVEIAVFLI